MTLIAMHQASPSTPRKHPLLIRAHNTSALARQAERLKTDMVCGRAAGLDDDPEMIRLRADAVAARDAWIDAGRPVFVSPEERLEEIRQGSQQHEVWSKLRAMDMAERPVENPRLWGFGIGVAVVVVVSLLTWALRSLGSSM